MTAAFPWLDFSRITWRKGQAPDEGGIDISEPTGQPITALSDGELVGAGTYWGHDVATVRTTVPGLGRADLYYQHIKLAPNIKPCQYGKCGGQKIHKGQVLGHANWGLVETGLNPPWYGIWGPSPHPSAWVDPEKYLRQLVGQSGQGSKVAPVVNPSDACLSCGKKGSPGYYNCTAQIAIGFVPDCAMAAYEQSQANTPSNVAKAVTDPLVSWLSTNIVSYAEHIAIFLLAITMIILGFILVGFAPAQKLATQAGKAVMLA